MFDNASPSLESSEVILSSTSKDKTYGEWMVVSRRKGKAYQGTLSLPLEKALMEMSHLKKKLVSLHLMPNLAVEKGKEKSWAPHPNQSQSLLISIKKLALERMATGKVRVPREEAPNLEASLPNCLVILPRQFQTYPLKLSIFQLDLIIILLIQTLHPLRVPKPFAPFTPPP